MDLSRHALHGIVKPTQQAQLPLHQSQRLQTLQRHYPMLRTPQQALPQCQRMQLPPRQAFALHTHHQALSYTSRRQLLPPQLWVLRALQQVLPQRQQMQPPSHQGLSAANFPTGTTCVSAGAEADPPVAGAVSTDATSAPTSAVASPTGANLAANADPAAPFTTAAASSKSPSAGGYTAGTLGAMMHASVKWGFTGQRALKQAKEWQMVLELVRLTINKHSQIEKNAVTRGNDKVHFLSNLQQ